MAANHFSSPRKSKPKTSPERRSSDLYSQKSKHGKARSRAVIHKPQEYAHQTSGIALKVQWPRRRILKKPQSQRALPASSSHCTPVRTDGDGPDA
jgi:hypothetical protein